MAELTGLNDLTSTQLIWFNKIEEDLLDYGITHVRDEVATVSLEVRPEPMLVAGKRDQYHIRVTPAANPRNIRDHFFNDRRQAILFYMNIASRP